MEDVLLHHEFIVSEYILAETGRTLREKFGYSDSDTRAVIAFLRGAALTVEPTALPPDSCRDPNDIPILGTAVAGSADIVIAVDRDLLALSSFRGISIVKPGEFWQQTS